MRQAKPPQPTWKDPIVEEVRAAREGLFAASEYDLDKFVARLRESELQRGRRTMSYSKRAPSKEPAE
jgi:hypothetical protein